MKILLAEDDAQLSFLTRICLERFGGHRVISCEDGQAALDLVRLHTRANKFDLILMDCKMPHLTGIEVAEALALENKHHPPIIFLSANSDPAVVSQFMALGLGHIQKPFNTSAICSQIEALLHSSHELVG